jgi:hypothetical protein
VFAGIILEGKEDQYLTLGAGLRATFTNLEDAAPNGSSDSKDFEVESVRLFTGGQIIKGVKGTFNTEKQADDSLRVLDAIAQLEFIDSFNLWFGRVLPPSDRANLASAYYANAFQYPGVVSQYPAIFAGRDDGATVWGRFFEGKLNYGFGVYEGHNNVSGGSNDSDELLYTGRIAYHFFDVEPSPAYYTTNTYYGSNDIFTVGFAFYMQDDGVGTAADRGDYLGWNADVLFEKKLRAGVLTLEGAYYDYDLDGARDCGDGLPGAVACPSGRNVGGLVEGQAYLGTIAWLFPAKIGWGQFQPYLRYQLFDRDFGDTENEQVDLGVNYVIAGHNARVTAVYSRLDDEVLANGDRDQFLIGVQLIY